MAYLDEDLGLSLHAGLGGAANLEGPSQYRAIGRANRGTVVSESSGAKAGAGDQVRAIEWREDSMATQFANVVNVQGTREQVDLFFGTNRTWNLAQTESVVVDLSNRVILTPLAAKRLHSVLGGVLAEYENRHGRLDLDA
ncbi:hypothetical protein EEDFHM_00989 [Methylorubrum populi]